jgi:hypothetical protein
VAGPVVETQSPETKPRRPSIVMSLRWSRRIQNWGRQAGRVEHPDLDAGPLELGPERRQRPRRGAEPIVEDPDRHARAGALGQRLREGAAGLVVGDDEVLEMDDASARPDRREPGR